MHYDWDFSVLSDWEILTALMRGFSVNVILTAAAIGIGTPIGVIAGLFASAAAVSSQIRMDELVRPRLRSKFLRAMINGTRYLTIAIIDLIRSIPLLLLILVAYYGIPILVEAVLNSSVGQYLWGRSSRTGDIALVSSVVALSINLAAFVADVVRGATAGVARGNVLAARSLAMTRQQIWRRIVIPDALRESFPAICLLWITIAKMSTLVSFVAVPDVLHQAVSIMNQNFRPLELFFAIGVVFALILVPLSWLQRRLERSQAFLRRSL